MAVELTYNIGEWYTKLDEAAALIGELSYVDKALAYLDGAEYTLDDGQLPTTGITFTLGWTHPFEKTVKRLGFDDDAFVQRAEAELGTYRSEGESWASSLKSGVESMVEDLTRIFGSEPDALNETCADLNNSLARDGADDFGGLAENLGVWKERSRDAFVNDWYNPFKDIRSNHCFVFSQLSSCYAVATSATRSAQHAAISTVEGARLAADEQLKLREQENRGPTAKDVVSLLSAVAGFAGAVTFFAPPASATFGIISATTGLAATAIPDEARETVTVEGQGAVELEESLDAELREVMSNWRSALDELAGDEIQGIETFMDDQEAVLRLYPRAPGIDGTPDPGDFHHESSGQY